jgi:hypothetical protein
MLALLPPREKLGVVFLAMFLRRLPSDLRDHLASKDFSTPNEMATRIFSGTRVHLMLYSFYDYFLKLTKL